MTHPQQSPLFHAEQFQRYGRQESIREYEVENDCRLVVIYDYLFPYSVNLLEELIFDASPMKDLHLMLVTPGGDGEAAVRIVRSAQARCKELTVLIPAEAKSAGTILALGAHHILMGPTSDLGPIDPQLNVGKESQNWVSAKDVIAAVAAAETAVQAKPETYPIHAALLSDVTALMVQTARSTLARSGDLMREALRSNPDRDDQTVKSLCNALQDPLIDNPKSHGAIFGESDALQYGLPVVHADPNGKQWQDLWRLWMKYFAENQRIYEGRTASKAIGPWGQ